MDNRGIHEEDLDENDNLSEEEFLTPDSNRRGKKKQRGRRPVGGGEEENDGVEGSQPKKKRTLPPRSGVWIHFTRWPNNYDMCDCNYCKKPMACPTTSGTTTLKTHLTICKSAKAWRSAHGIGEEDGNLTQQVLNQDGGFKSAKVPEHVFREAANEMIVIGELPLSFIEGMAFKHFCGKVNLYTPPSRRTSGREIVKMYAERKKTLREWFQKTKQRVSLTTDIWVCQHTGRSYMVITVHYIDNSWRLKKLIIGFKHVTDHRGKTICNTLLECLEDWGIERVFCVTVDNATANTNALSSFQSTFSLKSDESFVMNGDLMHIRCAGHIINLIVKDGMAEYGESVVAVRNAICYVRSGGKRHEAFEQRVDNARLTRGSLPLDVRTRWNSTYVMLLKAHKFKAAFEKMEFEDKPYNDHFLETVDGKKRVGPPAADNWREIERLMKFLNVFYQSTLIVSASTTLNAYKCYGEIVNIAGKLLFLCSSNDADLKVQAEAMFQKFDKYWDGLKNINKLLIIVSVMDPTKKMEFANMCFADLYGQGSRKANEMYESVTNIMRDMYAEYAERYKRSNESETQNESQTTEDQLVGRSESFSAEDDFIGFSNVNLRYNTLLKTIGVRATDELETYLREKVENPEVMMGIEFDVLSWWKVNCGKYPILSQMARDLFAMQVSSVASESAFSTSGRLITPFRSSLSPFMVEVLMCTEQWLKQDIKCESKVLTNAQILAEVEFEDELEKEFGFENQFMNTN